MLTQVCEDCGRWHHPEIKCELDFVPPHNPNRKPGRPDIRKEAIEAEWQRLMIRLAEEDKVASRPRTS